MEVTSKPTGTKWPLPRCGGVHGLGENGAIDGFEAESMVAVASPTMVLLVPSVVVIWLVPSGSPPVLKLSAERLVSRDMELQVERDVLAMASPLLSRDSERISVMKTIGVLRRRWLSSADR